MNPTPTETESVSVKDCTPMFEATFHTDNMVDATATDNANFNRGVCIDWYLEPCGQTPQIP